MALQGLWVQGWAWPDRWGGHDGGGSSFGLGASGAGQCPFGLLAGRQPGSRAQRWKGERLSPGLVTHYTTEGTCKRCAA